MPPTSVLADCRRFTDAVSAAGGRVPDVLSHILSGAALLASNSAISDPARGIVDSALAGELDGKRLADKLITEAATAQMIDAYRGELRQRSERMFTDAFHKALQNGGADQLLDSLRPAFDEHAEAIVAARDVIPPATPAEEFLRTAKPAAVTVWQQLDSHLATLAAIGAIAAQFGCRTGIFPQIEEFALGDGFRLDDRAIWCTDGPNLEADSAAFRRPDQGHRTSPWFRLPLKLHTVASAQARYNEWASGQWERLHAGPMASVIDENGRMRELPRPRNPYAHKELAK